jgi:hypothetical protein
MKPHLVLRALALVLAAASPALAQAPDAGPSPEDLKLLQEIGAAAAPEAPPAAAPAPPARGSNPFSNLFNPAMSVNGLVLGSLGAPPAGERGARGALQLQELELQLISNVDPYFTANITLTLPSGGTLDIEEGYIAAIPQLAGFGIRAGKIKAGFGKENAVHTHAFPFVNKSLVGEKVFGEEGLNHVSLEATRLLPLPWYALLTVTAMDGKGQSFMGAPQEDSLAGFASLRNVFDTSDDSTLEGGVSYAAGRGTDEHLAQSLGLHLTFKWRPARDAANSSAQVTLEGIAARQPNTLDVLTFTALPRDPVGFYGYVQYQLTHGWYAGARFDYLTDRADLANVTMRESAILVFAPTEFSAFRLQAQATQPPGSSTSLFEGFLQANFTIGAHPAHAY